MEGEEGGRGGSKKVGSGWRKRGRNVGMTTGGYIGPGGDPEGSEGGEPENPLADLGIAEGRLISDIEKAEATDPGAYLGDDSLPWDGHNDPPPTIPPIPPESIPEGDPLPIDVIPPVLPPEPPIPPEGAPVGTPTPMHPNQPDPPKKRPLRTKRPAVKLKKDVVTKATTVEVEFTFTVDLQVGPSAVVPVYSILFQSIQELMKPNFDEYYDQSRMGKTLLNLDDNEQLQIIN
jgi:hypothetical protein